MSDDLAEDISFRYKDLLGDKYTDEEASKKVIEEFESELDDEETTVFWLAFALIQWKLGRLQDEVKARAINIIDNGSDLNRWEEDPKEKKQREKVLLKLRDKLNSPQPKAKKVPKRFVAITDLKKGDVVSYQLLSDEYIILKVIGIIEQWTEDRYPLFEICDWQGKEIPTKEQIIQLPLKEWVWGNGNEKMNKLAIFPDGKRDDPSKRIKVVAEGIETVMDMEAPYTLFTWKEFDEKVKAILSF